ncbi:DUF1553 domain-containing protein [Tundrisphaera lichenicola]|uniref:DUF1553 domain-containing protein n=1 Tax=Tundrisphaera lichenicola TaxID=2029860 RepID=UPI003EBCE9FF
MRSPVVPALFLIAWFSCPSSARSDDPPRPPAPQGRVDFRSQIQPILQTRCLNCHAKGKYKGGLSMESREAILRGGESGAAAVPGKAAESLIVELVAGLDPVRRMPDKGDPLTPGEVGLIRAWVDQGLAWPEEITFGFRKASIAPRTPEVPASPKGLDLKHPIDRFIAAHLDEHGTSIGWETVPNPTFARRASLDLVGLIPTVDQQLLLDENPHEDRYRNLVRSLLDDGRGYADHWLTFWNDALRNSYRGTGFIDDGRTTITRWLYRSLLENKPYDQFTRELISPVPGSEGFTKGIVWRGVVNASQTPPVQAAQNISQVFLGTNLKCASCHDSFVNYWKLDDAYALAGVFSEKPPEINRCDKPTGKIAQVGFIYPELGQIDARAPRAERMKQLAEILVKPEDGRFARTIVNRLWAQMMGRGIVEPLDDMDQPAWSQDLLDWLAADFVANGHDLKHTLELIATSKAYRLPSEGVADPNDRSAYIFRGPLIRRMTAEQFADAVSTVTGVWPEVSGDMVKADGRGQGGQVAAARAAVAASAEKQVGDHPEPPRVEARWIWSHADAARDPGGRILVRKVIQLDKVPTSALAVATCDNEVVLYVNGKKVGQSAEWTNPISAEVSRHLKVGENVIALEATNWPDPENGKGTQIKGTNPAGLIAWVGGFDDGRPAWGFGTDATWLWAEKAPKSWMTEAEQSGSWKHSAELPGAEGIYGGQVNLQAVVARSGAVDDGSEIRAALNFDDPLMSALGRTSREQVVTRRDPIATTLQALELTNGSTLDAKLKRGATLWIEKHGRDPEALVRQLFLIALGRSVTPDELDAARELIGSPATPEGVQDLLWAVAMLPEFQLID